MGRTIGAVVFGYVVMFVVVFVALTALYFLLGADRAFQPGSYDVSLLWALVSVVVGFGAAWVGGRVARTIAHEPRGPKWLAGVVVVLGLALAIPVLLGSGAADAVRDATVGNLEAMQRARTPVWSALLNPLIGAIGVLLGGRAWGARTDSVPPPPPPPAI